MSDAVWVLVPLGAFTAIAWVIHVIVDGFRRRQQLRISTEFHTKLLERVGSATEFGEFLNSPGGTRFLDSLSVEREGGAHVRILRATQSGTILTVLGSALFIWNWLRPPAGTSVSISAAASNGVSAIATILFALGIGLLLSARLSYRLSKEMGLLDANPRQAGDRTLPTS
jgi:hypothetical protein